MYLTNFEKSIPPVYKIISEYLMVSGYKINMEKNRNNGSRETKNITQNLQQSITWCVIGDNKQQMYFNQERQVKWVFGA